MSAKTIVVLGGYGGAGKTVCEELLRWTDAEIIIAGRSMGKAGALSERLAADFPGRRVFTAFADAADLDSLRAAFKNASLVVDATTAIHCVAKVAEAAMEAGIDFLDLHFDQKVVSILESLKDKILKSGCCFITQAGFHPGLPAAFVRFAASRFDKLTRADIGMAMDVAIENTGSVYELIDLMADYKAEIFTKGSWKKATYADVKRFTFGERFGLRTCYPVPMEEMRVLPGMFPLEETGVYAAGFNWFVDYLVFPLAILLSSIHKGLGRDTVAWLFVFGLKHFFKGNRGVSFVLEAEGVKDGNPARMRVLAKHTDAYGFTALAAAACIRQYLDQEIARPGLWLMGHVVDPDCLMKDMEAMGVDIQISFT